MNATEEIVHRIYEHVEDLARRVTVSDMALDALREIANIVWAEAYYDPFNESTRQFAERLAPYLDTLNKELKFKK